MRIGHGYDIHRFTAGDGVTLGGVRIAHTHSLLAHSDGDVVLHALCDALLGAMGEGDIGRHFPDSDPRYRGIDSRELLRACMAIARGRKLRVANADITIIAEAPRISAHVTAMRDRIAADIGCAAERLNIKATTNEGLGAIGRGEGIASHAVVLLTEAESGEGQ